MTTTIVDYPFHSWKHQNLVEHGMEHALPLWELALIREAANHSYWCDCPACLRFWAIRRTCKQLENGTPNNPKWMGPFMDDTIQAALLVRTIEDALWTLAQAHIIELPVFFTSEDAKNTLALFAYCGGGEWQYGDGQGVGGLDIAFVPADLKLATDRKGETV